MSNIQEQGLIKFSPQRIGQRWHEKHSWKDLENQLNDAVSLPKWPSEEKGQEQERDKAKYKRGGEKNTVVWLSGRRGKRTEEKGGGQSALEMIGGER